MRRLPLLTFAVVFAGASIPALAQAITWTTKYSGVPVCRTQQVLDRIDRMRADGDSEAYVRFTMAAVIAGECIVLDKGETVYGRVESIWSGALRVRKRGDVVEYLATSRMFDLDPRK